MPGLGPGIHVLLSYFVWKKDVDGRDKPGHDSCCYQSPPPLPAVVSAPDALI
jgi:hypothetical protein